METLSLPQARKLALLSQGLPITTHKGVSGTLAAIRQLGYVQLDTISVVARAHDHVLWTRVKNYRPEYIDQLLQQQQLFEYWSHAAAYLPMEDFRFSLPRKARMAQDGHWFKRDHKIEQEVLARIRAEGPLQAKDFQKPEDHQGGWWRWKPAKQALEQLFMAGELMCPRRIGFQKVYDLTERVLPKHIDQKMPTEIEMVRHLIQKNLHSHGLLQINEIGYLQKNVKTTIKQQTQIMMEEGILLPIKVGDRTYLTSMELLSRLGTPLSRKKACLLSPFDNLVIQRKRLQQLFNFDYQMECYVPAQKRVYGYYVLPVLWRGELVARMDAKADRQQSILFVKKLVLEPQVKDIEDFVISLKLVLEEYATFNGCKEVLIQETTPSTLRLLLN